MEFIDQVLAMLGSIAGVLGVVVSYLQYRAARGREHVRAATVTGAGTGIGPAPVSAMPRGSAPPPSVRIACFWVVADALIVVGVWLALFIEVVDNRHGFGFVVPDIPETVVVLGPLVLAALIGIVKVPGAIHRGAGLRRREAAMRGKLLGSAAVDLFLGAILVVVALSLRNTVSVPDPVFSVLTLYIGYRILSGVVDIVLLTHRDTRTWVEPAAQPAGRPR